MTLRVYRQRLTQERVSTPDAIQIQSPSTRRPIDRGLVRDAPCCRLHLTETFKCFKCGRISSPNMRGTDTHARKLVFQRAKQSRHFEPASKTTGQTQHSSRPGVAGSAIRRVNPSIAWCIDSLSLWLQAPRHVLCLIATGDCILCHTPGGTFIT